jgi:hypothetical protein
MFIGFGLTAASMIFTYFEGNYFFDESLLGTTSVPQKTMEILSEIGTNLSYLMFMVGVLGFLWFVSQVKPRDNRKTANKSSNTDASDAGAS